MAMTKKRKNLQDRLRRKFGWSTNTNYNRGTILEKPEASSHLNHDPKYVTDLCVNFHDYGIRREIFEGNGRSSIEITLYKYKINEDETYTMTEALAGRISLDELELIYKIAKEKKFEICRDILESGRSETTAIKNHICNKLEEDSDA